MIIKMTEIRVEIYKIKISCSNENYIKLFQLPDSDDFKTNYFFTTDRSNCIK